MVTRCRLARPKFLSSKQVRLRQPALLYGTHSGVSCLSLNLPRSFKLHRSSGPDFGTRHSSVGAKAGDVTWE